MNISKIFAVALAATLFSMSAFAADSNSGALANSSASTTSAAGSYNGGNNIITNNPGTVDYSGSFTQRNVPSMSLGSFGNSFSSDYCSGTRQAAVSLPGVGISGGGQVLDNGCQLLRSADMIMRIAGVYAAESVSAWEFQKTIGHEKSAFAFGEQIRAESFKKAEKADDLKDAAVNMICAISEDTRQALVDAAVSCPTKKH